jgi:hypothetical protein
VVAYARANFARAQIEALRGDRDDLIERVKLVETQNVALTAALKAETTKREALEKVVTGKEDLEAILHRLDLHDRTAAAAADNLLEKITDLRSAP